MLWMIERQILSHLSLIYPQISPLMVLQNRITFMQEIRSSWMKWVEEGEKCYGRLTSPYLRYSAVLVAVLSLCASHHNSMRHHKIM